MGEPAGHADRERLAPLLSGRRPPRLRSAFLLVGRMEQGLPELADVLFLVPIADDAIDLARDADIAAPGVADDSRAVLVTHLVSVGADPVVVLDHGLDPDVLGELDAHPRQKRARVAEILQVLCRVAFPKCRPKGSFLMISERADRSTIF